MDFLKRLKDFLHFDYNTKSDQSSNSTPANNIRDEIIIKEDPRQNMADEYDRFGFNVFSSPLEMHRYFEHQMNEMMKSFGVFGNHDSFFGSSCFGGNGTPFFDDNPFSNDFSQFPAIDDMHKNNQQRSLRDQYLKSGYQEKDNKQDEDLDGKFDMSEFGSIINDKPTQPMKKSFIFSQSMMSKTIRNADGSIETQKTVRGHDGKEETTITKKQGDKEYSITTRIDENGQKEIIENIVNIDDNHKQDFVKGNRPGEIERLPPNWFPFDSFFR